MIIISSCGGSGSSFVRHELKVYGWKVCKRPDKVGEIPYEIFKDRMKHFVKITPKMRNYTGRQLFRTAYKALRNKEKTAILSMTWGAKGFFDTIDDTVVYLFRDPVMTFNSFSGGGWYPEIRIKRIRQAGGKDKNDPKWIEAFFGDYCLWLKSAENAIEMIKTGKGKIVRYYRFKEDWERLDLPPIYKTFESKDSMEKVRKHLKQNTIDHIRRLTDKTWEKIKKL